ncbi:hypothetical protein [Roseobacter sinensis]|uniref:hypothetical protein n=1 Tax=Roseobacter sinensis TaxID=2931391 RepID=UPI002982A107|nr:hypothetical protein [Roseobacter sp. WL0113]
MAALIILFPVVRAFQDGLMRVPRGMLDLARPMGSIEAPDCVADPGAARHAITWNGLKRTASMRPLAR